MSASDEYEMFVAEVMREVFGVDAIRGKDFVGRVTQRKIKVDAAFELEIAGGARLLCILECKHYKHRVSVADVEEFHSKLDDIGAHKGIMLTTVGYQEGAKKAALGRGIALALLTSESQPGEIAYVVAGPRTFRPVQIPDLLQGNICGLITDYEYGMRFNGFGQVIGMLIVDACTKQDGK
jgi:Restriction endonuclease